MPQSNRQSPRRQANNSQRFSQILSRLSAGIISAKALWRTIRSPASTRRIKPDDTCYQMRAVI